MSQRLLNNTVRLYYWLEQLTLRMIKARHDVMFEYASARAAKDRKEASSWFTVIVVDTEGNILHEDNHVGPRSYVMSQIKPLLPKGYTVVKTSE